ncbi:hydroxyacylglutathione hydrolase [Thiomicrorhabdus sp. Kp2]|uniref:hydroxyacylglutathione hydrolase n=1 Tax=Thiomicrorhabdus sp. Kp2 TaxID=1123518 RepID=UPI00040E523B|nr:hydroxyacylglutathione hydrolase [Thiomicrorhabdus sp. Kp2]
MNIVGLPALVGTYDNYIWIIHDNYQAWVVDPGESKQVIDYLTENHLTLKGILITHQHFDHIDGIDTLLEFAPQTIVYGPKKIKHPAIQIACKEGDTLKLNKDLEFKVLEIPGHTKDHIAFYNDELLFCGDTLFTAGCGRILGGTAEQFSESILKLRSLPDHLQFFCGHEYTQTNLTFSQLVEPENQALQKRIAQTNIIYPSIHQGAQSTLGEEKETNPFLRFDTPALQAKLIQRGASSSNSSLFSALRAWKDEFDRTH